MKLRRTLIARQSPNHRKPGVEVTLVVGPRNGAGRPSVTSDASRFKWPRRTRLLLRRK
jgi:hypothetical protein